VPVATAPLTQATPANRAERRSNLIVDVGMHVGQDTAFYLAKGFDVVAVEANPDLVAAARERFAGELETGRLRIVSGAIAESAGTQRLAVAEERTIWSSLSENFVRRNEERGTHYRYVEVPAIRFEDLLAEVGIPHYLKVDIEGFDMLCVRALRRFDVRPDFVSIESAVASSGSGSHSAFDELAELWSLGYRRFSYVDQSKGPEHRPPQPPREGRYSDWTFDIDGSGLFGEELSTRWLSPEEALLRAQFLRAQHGLIGLGGRFSRTPAAKAARRARTVVTGREAAPWYDLHARLS
jgi:FkbM family methyltransferase